MAKRFARRPMRRKKRNYTWLGVRQTSYSAMSTGVNAFTLFADGMSNSLVEDAMIRRVVGNIGFRYQNTGGLGFFGMGIHVAEHDEGGLATIWDPLSTDVDTYAQNWRFLWQGEVPWGPGWPDSLDNITVGSESLLLTSAPLDLKFNARLDKRHSLVIAHRAASNGDMQINANLRVLVENNI